MNKFVTLSTTIIPLSVDNVDTDMIIPAQHLKSISREGYGENLFSALRSLYPDFILNQPAYAQGKILLSKGNFGCGSSREHAVWAIQQYGIQAVICSSFSDIFFNNAAKNGLLLITLPAAVIDAWLKLALADCSLTMTIDLAAQTISYAQQTQTFAYDIFRKHCLINGLNDLDYLIAQQAAISSYEARHLAVCPTAKNIAILAGDGIGPEVMTLTLQVLDAISTKFGHSFKYSYGLVGGAAYEVYQQHLPAATIQLCQQADAILFGSVGGPVQLQSSAKWANCEANSILALRKAFNFNINLRKMAIYPQIAALSPLKPELLANGLDIIIFRELLGDIYFGAHILGEKDGSRFACDSAEYTEEQIRSIADYAFKVALSRGKKLVSVDKANVLATSKLWRIIVAEVALNYPEVSYTDMLVDNCAMQIIKNPAQFDVILTANLFGDILSDELSVLAGSIGMMPSASFSSSGLALYEPAGGSAADIAGKNIANPIAQILSAAMMLNYSFGMHAEAAAIEAAVHATIVAGYRTADLWSAEPGLIRASSSEFTAQIIANLPG